MLRDAIPKRLCTSCQKLSNIVKNKDCLIPIGKHQRVSEKWLSKRPLKATCLQHPSRHRTSASVLRGSVQFTANVNLGPCGLGELAQQCYCASEGSTVD